MNALSLADLIMLAIARYSPEEVVEEVANGFDAAADAAQEKGHDKLADHIQIAANDLYRLHNDLKARREALRNKPT